MSCLKVKQKLNEALLNGASFVLLDNLTPINIQELEECGYIVIKQNNKFKIMT
jgi:nicotinate-nucleotide pyrophosphorylase